MEWGWVPLVAGGGSIAALAINEVVRRSERANQRLTKATEALQAVKDHLGGDERLVAAAEREVERAVIAELTVSRTQRLS